jgi:glutathione S-transferase
MSELLTLYSYWRSSAAYRVRIALNLKQVKYAQKAVHLLNQGGEQRLPEFREVNPQGLIPVLVDGERVIVSRWRSSNIWTTRFPNTLCFRLPRAIAPACAP